MSKPSRRDAIRIPVMIIIKLIWAKEQNPGHGHALSRARYMYITFRYNKVVREARAVRAARVRGGLRGCFGTREARGRRAESRRLLSEIGCATRLE